MTKRTPEIFCLMQIRLIGKKFFSQIAAKSLKVNRTNNLLFFTFLGFALENFAFDLHNSHSYTHLKQWCEQKHCEIV